MPGMKTAGIYRPSTLLFSLRNSNSSGPGDIDFVYGLPGDSPLVGNWTGKGPDKVGIHRPTNSLFSLRQTNGPTSDTVDIFLGNPGDTPLVGDWNGAGLDKIGIHRGNLFSLRQTNDATSAVVDIFLGNPGDTPLVGDWNGAGLDKIGIHRGNLFSLRQTNDATSAAVDIFFGNPGDIPLTGRWNKDNKSDCIGIYRPQSALFSLRKSNDPNDHSIFEFTFLVPQNPLPQKQILLPLVGDWNGQGYDSVGLYEPSQAIFFLRCNNEADSGSNNVIYGLQGLDVPLMGNWSGT